METKIPYDPAMSLEEVEFLESIKTEERSCTCDDQYKDVCEELFGEECGELFD